MISILLKGIPDYLKHSHGVMYTDFCQILGQNPG